MMRLTEMLEDHDDVQNVYANFEIEIKPTVGRWGCRQSHAGGLLFLHK